ncbi:MAG: hypothetical protein OEZ34_12295, partial [Spirochaetia bacterium]|nr:hypothetical protein [Spirochaetia bacterium]
MDSDSSDLEWIDRPLTSVEENYLRSGYRRGSKFIAGILAVMAVLWIFTGYLMGIPDLQMSEELIILFVVHAAYGICFFLVVMLYFYLLKHISMEYKLVRISGNYFIRKTATKNGYSQIFYIGDNLLHVPRVWLDIYFKEGEFYTVEGAVSNVPEILTNFARTKYSISALVVNDKYSVDKELTHYPGIYRKHYSRWIITAFFLIGGILTVPVSLIIIVLSIQNSEYITTAISSLILAAGCAMIVFFFKSSSSVESIEKKLKNLYHE